MENITLKILEEIEETLFSKGNVVTLTDPAITEHERGRILGMIQMVQKIRMELEGYIANDKSTTVQ